MKKSAPFAYEDGHLINSNLNFYILNVHSIFAGEKIFDFCPNLLKVVLLTEKTLLLIPGTITVVIYFNISLL